MLLNCLLFTLLLSVTTLSVTGAPLNEGGGGGGERGVEGGGGVVATTAPTVISEAKGEEVDYYEDYEYEDTLENGTVEM